MSYKEYRTRTIRDALFKIVELVDERFAYKSALNFYKCFDRYLLTLDHVSIRGKSTAQWTY